MSSTRLTLQHLWRRKTKAIPSNIVRGFLRSDHLVNELSNIPCDIVQTLTTDADQAQQFVQQIQNGQVPTIIQDLPQEVISGISDVVSIAISLPSQILDAAESAVTEAADVFNEIENGTIVSHLEQIPGIIVSDITAGWKDLTSGLENAWNGVTSGVACFFGDCPTPTAGGNTCPKSTAAATTNYASPTPTYRYGAAASSSAAYASYTSESAAYEACTASESAAASSSAFEASRVSVSQASVASGQQTTSTLSSTSCAPQQSQQCTTESSPSIAGKTFGWDGAKALAMAAIGVLALALWL